MANKQVKPALPPMSEERGEVSTKKVKKALPEQEFYQKPVGKKKVKKAIPERHAVLANKRTPRKR